MDLSSLPSFQPADTGQLQPISVLGSFGRGVANTIPLGEQAVAGASSVLDNTSYDTARQGLDQDIAADKAQNPGARLAGQATGLIAPIVATAGLAAPESLAEAAGQGALIGGGFGAGNAIDTKAAGGTNAQAATQLGLGAATGALGGAAGEGLSNAIGKAVGVSLPSAEEFTAGNVAGVLDGTGRQVNKLSSDDPVGVLNKMGGLMRTTEVNGEPLIGTFDRQNDTLQKFNTLEDQAGQTIGSQIKSANIVAPPVNVTDIVSQIPDPAKIISPVDKETAQNAINAVKQYADAQGNVSFEALQTLKTDIGDQAFGGTPNHVLSNLYHKIDGVQQGELEKISNMPGIDKPAFDLAKKQYAMAAKAIPLLKMGVAREITKKVSTTLPGIGLITGHPIAAAAALAKDRVAQIGNRLLFKAGNIVPGALAGGAERASSGLGSTIAAKQLPDTPAPTDVNLNHPAMAPWRSMFKSNEPPAMAAGGVVPEQESPEDIQRSNAVMDFTLSQRDPAYAKAKQDAADNPVEEQQTGLEAPKMAEGGIVGQVENMKPVEGFGSTLQGFQNMVSKKGSPEPNTPPQSAQPVAKTPAQEPSIFNDQLSQQLRAYLMNPNDKQDEE